MRPHREALSRHSVPITLRDAVAWRESELTTLWTRPRAAGSRSVRHTAVCRMFRLGQRTARLICLRDLNWLDTVAQPVFAALSGATGAAKYFRAILHAVANDFAP